MNEPPPYLLPFLLDPPRPETESIGGVDLYLPSGVGRAPAVVLVHGGPIRPGMVSPREWPAYVGYGGLLAGAGLVGVMLHHRFVEGDSLTGSLEDLQRAIETARSHSRVDPDRIVVWAFSAGGCLLGPVLADPPPGLCAVAATYAYLGDLEPGDGIMGPLTAVAGGLRVPALVTRVEHELDWVEESVAAWLAATAGADVTVIDVPGAHHGFETIEHTDAARQAVGDGIQWIVDRTARH